MSDFMGDFRKNGVFSQIAKQLNALEKKVESLLTKKETIFILPSYTTAERNALTPTNGMVIYNSTTGTIQGRASGAWVDL